MMKSVSTEILIPFHDVDPLKIVWHGRYVKYFEVVRCELLESFDYNYEQMIDSGYAWPVVDMRIKYVKPVVFGQTVVVKATLAEWENRLKVNYEITDRDSNERLTKGYTIQVAVDLATNEMGFESPCILFEKLGITR